MGSIRVGRFHPTSLIFQPPVGQADDPDEPWALVSQIPQRGYYFHMESTRPADRPPLPWWREPMAIGFFSVVFLASVAVLSKGWFAPPPPPDPAKPAVLPGEGAFCNTPTPVQSTLENPSTRSVVK